MVFTKCKLILSITHNTTKHKSSLNILTMQKHPEEPIDLYWITTDPLATQNRRTENNHMLKEIMAGDSLKAAPFLYTHPPHSCLNKQHLLKGKTTEGNLKAVSFKLLWFILCATLHKKFMPCLQEDLWGSCIYFRFFWMKVSEAFFWNDNAGCDVCKAGRGKMPTWYDTAYFSSALLWLLLCVVQVNGMGVLQQECVQPRPIVY